MSVLNLHEDERQKPQYWIPIGWMPIYDDKRSKCRNKGYESLAARKARLFHDCFRKLLSTWDEKTKQPQNVVWGGGGVGLVVLILVVLYFCGGLARFR